MIWIFYNQYDDLLMVLWFLKCIVDICLNAMRFIFIIVDTYFKEKRNMVNESYCAFR